MRRVERPSRAPRSTPLWKIPSLVNDSTLIIGVMSTAAKKEKLSAPMVWTDECVFPLAASWVYPKTRVWGSREKTLHCFSATSQLSGNSRRGCENSSGKTTAGSALDANGNTATKTDSTGTTNYTWDFNNRLTSVTLPGSGGTVSFKYDPSGRRIYKASASGTSIYAYDDDNVIEETNAAGAPVARYTQMESMDEPLAILRSSTTSYYERDGLGSVTSLSNSAGALAQTYTFDSFGNQTASSGSLTNSFQYTSREFDAETSLYYMRARYFDPTTARFISEDPTRFRDGVNFYRYVRNDPVDNTDPTGFTTYKGFPADKEAQMKNAVAEALSKLTPPPGGGCGGSNPPTPPCAGADGPKLANLIQNATFVYQPNSKNCGQTGPASVLGFRHVFGVGPAAFGPSCCSLASTLVHEAVHGLGNTSETKPDQIEKSCFGCPTQ